MKCVQSGTPNQSSDFAHEPTEPTGRVTSVQLSHLHVPPAESQTRANTKH